MHEIPEIAEKIAGYQDKRNAANDRLVAAQARLQSLAGDDVMVNAALASIKAIRERRHDPVFRLKLRDYIAHLVEGVFVYLDGAHALRGSLGAVYNLARGDKAVEGLLDYLQHTDGKSGSFKQSNQVRMRAFSIALRSGMTRTVFVVCKKNGSWYAVLSVCDKRKIVRKDGLTRLCCDDDRSGRVTVWQDTINLHRSDFESEEDYREFRRAYGEAYPTATQHFQKN